MTKIHREVFARFREVRAVNLDTPYGFQENVPQMTEKLVDYFDTSLHVKVTPLHFTSFADSTEVERALFKGQVREASYVFAGPGSPSYALSQWEPLGLEQDLEAVLANDGTICFASAAVLTLGAFTAPIYEIYKAGTSPFWLKGLNLMSSFGLNCVLIPHFDNNEGGNYDTSCCYLGRRRLELLEHELPKGTATLGIDEHTAVVFDLARDTIEVKGRANAYWRCDGKTRVLENGALVALDELRRGSSPPTSVSKEPFTIEVTELPSDAAALAEVAAGGGHLAVDALAALVRIAHTGGAGFIDPTPLVEGILAQRTVARSEGNYALSDALRDILLGAGVDVFDTPSGATWSLKA